MGDLAKPILELYSNFCRGGRRRRTPNLVEIPSVHELQNDIVGIVVNKASVIGDDEGRGFVIVADVYESIVLGSVLLVAIWTMICLKDESISQAPRPLLFQNQLFQQVDKGYSSYGRLQTVRYWLVVLASSNISEHGCIPSARNFHLLYYW